MKNRTLLRAAAILFLCLWLLPLFACGNEPAVASSSPEEESPESSLPAESSEESPVDTRLTALEFIEAMKDTPYTLDAECRDPIGLSDSTAVGIVQDRFENEILYPVPEDEYFGEQIYRAEDYGFSVENESNTPAFRDLIAVLKTVEGPKKVIFQPGTYRFGATLDFSDLKDTYFCSASPTERFEILMNGWMVGMNIARADNLYFYGFNLDYAISPTISGTVVSYDRTKRIIVIQVDDEFDLNNALYDYGNSIKGTPEVISFTTDPVTGRLVPDPNGIIKCGGEVSQQTSYDAEKNQLTVSLYQGNIVSNNLDPGTPILVSYTMYQYFGIHITDCGKIYMDHASVYCAAGMALNAGGCDGVYLNHFYLDLKEGSSRLMTATADGLHTCDVREVKVTNSIFRYSHDDSFNVKNSYIDVKAAVNKTITVRTGAAFFTVGDEVEIYEDTHFGVVGRYTITEIKANGSSTELVVDRNVDEAAVGCLLADITRATKLTLENTLIGNKRNRGILLQTRNSVIRNCTFQNIVHGPMNIYTIRDQFKEGICPAFVTVENNKFINNSNDISVFTYGTVGVTAGLLEKIDIKNNFLYGARQGSTSVSGVRNSEVCNNLFAMNNRLGSSADGYAISIANSKDSVVRDNYCYNTQKTDIIRQASGMENMTIERNRFVRLK